MQRRVLVSVAITGPVLFFAMGRAEVPAAPVDFEADCRACHSSGVPDRHHSLYDQPIIPNSMVPYADADGDGFPDATYGCLNCHDSHFTVVRDCVTCHTSPAGTVPDGTALAENPVTVTPAAGGDLMLSWDPSCDATDTDYAIYAGTLGNFTSHAPLLCSTGGATSATFAPPQGSAYFLVVPGDHWSEGSYGLDGDGAQRPPSATACLSQSIGCP